MFNPDSLVRAVDNKSTPSPQLWAPVPWLSFPAIRIISVFAQVPFIKEISKSKKMLNDGVLKCNVIAFTWITYLIKTTGKEFKPPLFLSGWHYFFLTFKFSCLRD